MPNNKITNIGVIFAGGVGSRMRSKDKPKQFLNVHEKPIIIHTLEVFERSDCIDCLAIACVDGWIEHLESLVKKYNIKKVKKIVSGGDSGQMSIYNGLTAAKEIAGVGKAIVLIHDGVRPLVNAELLAKCVDCVKTHGSAITTGIVKETLTVIDENGRVVNVPSRKNSRVAKAPQCFWLDDILEVHKRAQCDGVTDSIDSCTLMHAYGKKLFTVDGPYENIKITTPDDFYMMRAILDARENAQLLGDE